MWANGIVNSANVIAILFCVLGNVTANVGFKRMVETANFEPTLANAAALITNPWAWLGGAGSLLLLFSYLYAIRSMPLGVAYPIATSLGTVAVALAGVLIFSESLRASNIIGIALVVTGVLLISR